MFVYFTVRDPYVTLQLLKVAFHRPKLEMINRKKVNVNEYDESV